MSGWSRHSQHIVEAAAERVGVPVTTSSAFATWSRGKLTADLRGCGDVPDRQNDGNGPRAPGGGNNLITYIDGKRCWINKVIYGDRSANAPEQDG